MVIEDTFPSKEEAEAGASEEQKDLLSVKDYYIQFDHGPWRLLVNESREREDNGEPCSYKDLIQEAITAYYGG